MASVSVIKGTSYSPFATGALSSTAFLTDTVGFNNSTVGMTSFDLQIVGSFSTPPTGGTMLSLYLIGEIDGSNYPTPPGTSSALPPPNFLVGTYVFTGGTTTYMHFYDCPITLPYQCRLVLCNLSGQTLTISASTMQPKTIQVV